MIARPCFFTGTIQDYGKFTIMSYLKGSMSGWRKDLGSVRRHAVAALALAASLLFFPGGASAAPDSIVTLTWYGGGAAGTGSTTPGGGGPFNANVSSGPLAGSTFITFCLETLSHVGMRSPYHYELSTDVKFRGGTTPIRLTNDTAYLYSKFRSMNLTSFTTPADYILRSSLVDLQEAIWAQEGLKSVASLSVTGRALYDEAEAAAWQNLGNVRVMNLGVTPGDYSIQDQLAIVPIPASVWLFGSCLLGLVGISRRKRSV